MVHLSWVVWGQSVHFQDRFFFNNDFWLLCLSPHESSLILQDLSTLLVFLIKWWFQEHNISYIVYGLPETEKGTCLAGQGLHSGPVEPYFHCIHTIMIVTKLIQIRSEDINTTFQRGIRKVTLQNLVVLEIILLPSLGQSNLPHHLSGYNNPHPISTQNALTLSLHILSHFGTKVIFSQQDFLAGFNPCFEVIP